MALNCPSSLSGISFENFNGKVKECIKSIFFSPPLSYDIFNSKTWELHLRADMSSI